MHLVFDSNMLFKSTLRLTFLYLLKRILHPSFPPSIDHQFCGMPTRVAPTAHTPLQPGTHPPAASASQTTESANLHKHISVSAPSTWPAALVLTTLQQGKAQHAGRCLILPFLPPSFHLCSSRLHSVIQPIRNTDQLCHLPHAFHTTEVALNLVIFTT